MARKEGLLALENYEVDNPFLQQGVQLLADGHEPEFVKKVLGQEIDLSIERAERGENVFRALGDVAPAMGMIGTLIGLVQMLSNMDDPKKIGPAMAIALLTTLYGAVIANAIALPLADKLAARNTEERLNRTLILEGLISIQEGLNPRVIEELLKTYLPTSQRQDATDEAA
ncbi:Chemotaxis protein PomA [wastewater metagenome]|uniref:Chemotaxis protein PomA n=2 Tax=unclassified sequences TaxID=12908 RepID=A0A5B8RF03_9ZZZZ|nr:chemotaxis protein PomA [uncultured organism]